jgi:ectoine hydroxylase-related dioxygenase (phytanoyl-CoA dioxygenase family)
MVQLPHTNATAPSASSSTRDSLREAFERDGYVIVETGIPHDLLDRAAADMAPYLARRARIQDAWRKSRAVRQIATWPQVLDTMASLYGDRPLPFQTLNFRMGTEQAIHSDTIHFNTVPHGRMGGAWVALEDVDADNGPLQYYPGSHLWPEVTMYEVEKAGYFRRDLLDRLITLSMRAGVPGYEAGRHYGAYERYIADLVARSGAQPAYGHVKKGQAILWAANLLHGGAPHKDKSRTRHSQVTHYFFGGARYWTPVHSHGSFTYWRRPRWITP